MSTHLIIVGAGQAAAQTILTLTQKRYPGRITVVGDEPYPPYQRPPLSKKYLSGELERERLFVRPTEFYEQHGVTLILGAKAERLEPVQQRLTLADGRQLDYDRLLLATGSRVRKIDVPGADLAGIHYLRTIADADGILGGLGPDKRLVIVGAGYIGLEIAAVARAHRAHVTVLEATDRVMARVVCPEVGTFYRGVHEAAGVEIACDTAVRGFAGDDHVTGVIASDGREYPCDVAVVGIGIVPETELAEQAGLVCDDGIRVDEYACTSEPQIYAAGDCTNHPNAVLGRRIRLESVHNAIEQSKTAALSLLGEPAAYAQIPWFWSDQYDLKLQIAGISTGYDRVVLRGDPAERKFAAYYLRDSRLIAVDAINSPKDFLLGKRLVAQGAMPSPQRIEDTTADLATVESGDPTGISDDGEVQGASGAGLDRQA
ncbi:MAG: FAD-dependent oxidoreductase [Gammaproteobacteria bacterium]|nr:FAD-dependent oxidoreductase [Gammaproteobacteria bacterium]MDH3506899.1 FAD-dependent oxidoreductase [Gammaproteobacteria bacterium]